MKYSFTALPLWARLFGLLLCIGVGRPALAQLPSTAITDPNMIRPMTDTARVAKPLTKQQKREQAAADSVLKTERLFGLHVTRPQKAGLLALIPGTGQIYNKRWWKLPLVYGMVGTLAGVEYFYQSHYSDYRKAKDLIAAGKITNAQLAAAGSVPIEAFGAAKNENTVARIESGIIFYRRYRDMFILVFAAGYGLQILDAVVDAHLHDFDVGNDLSLHLSPALLPIPGQLLPGVGGTVALRLK
jgi:hypothetical protein